MCSSVRRVCRSQIGTRWRSHRGLGDGRVDGAPLLHLQAGEQRSLSARCVPQPRGTNVWGSSMESSGCGHAGGIRRTLLLFDRLSRFQVDLSASNSGRADGGRRFGLGDLPFTTVRRPSVAVQLGRRRFRTRISNGVASREGRRRSTMEGAGRGRFMGQFPEVGKAPIVRIIRLVSTSRLLRSDLSPNDRPIGLDAASVVRRK